MTNFEVEQLYNTISSIGIAHSEVKSEVSNEYREALQTASNLTRAWIKTLNEKDRREKGLKFIQRIATQYWKHTYQNKLSFDKFPVTNAKASLDKTITSLADSIALSSSKLTVTEGCYYIGSLYTIILTNEERAEKGAYYTPPNLVDRVVSNIHERGFHLNKASILDPACGSGIFLVAIVEKVEAASKNSKQILEWVNRQITGWEIDRVAGWLAQLFIEVALKRHQIKEGNRIKQVVKICDTVIEATVDIRKFDLIVGNPPYGKIKLTDGLRKAYSRSLYGHANLYGIFMDIALAKLSRDGIIAVVTPTSYLSGEYFKQLRLVYSKEVSPVLFDFVDSRKGVFQDVLQETLISVFTKGKYAFSYCKVNEIQSGLNKNYEWVNQIEFLGEISTKTFNHKPWLLPRSRKQAETLAQLIDCPQSLIDWGYEINTGQLVWNRHKMQLKQNSGQNKYPLIWAESITNDGRFKFSAGKKNHTPYIEIYKNQGFLVTRNQCIILQRTTSKEQQRRLQSCLLPKNLAAKGVVIENHVNIIKPVNPQLSIELVDKILKSSAVDTIFRTISGSVAVSAYELESIPLPPFAKVKKAEKRIMNAKTAKIADQIINRLFSI